MFLHNYYRNWLLKNIYIYNFYFLVNNWLINIFYFSSRSKNCLPLNILFVFVYLAIHNSVYEAEKERWHDDVKAQRTWRWLSQLSREKLPEEKPWTRQRYCSSSSFSLCSKQCWDEALCFLAWLGRSLVHSVRHSFCHQDHHSIQVKILSCSC